MVRTGVIILLAAVEERSLVHVLILIGGPGDCVVKLVS